MKSNIHSGSRRHFLKTAATLAAGAVAGPAILPRSLFGANAPANRLTMGFIGMGKQSRDLLRGFLGSPTARVVAVCDVDTTRRNDAKQKVDKFYANSQEKSDPCAAYQDFREIINRKDIDAVCIATPDHWHALITLAALHAGKDVYCEKPLTHNIHEAVEVMRAVK